MKYYALLLVFCIYPTIACAQVDSVSSFVVVTDQQTISPDTLSAEITAQAQQAEGVSTPVGETFDIVFTSSSQTGFFLNSSGNPASTVMSKNTANRTFYYKDSSTGTFVLTITLTGRESKRAFVAQQSIVVGSGGGGASTTAPVTALSTHSSPAPLQQFDDTIALSVSAGRDRLVTIGNPLTFKAAVAQSKNIPESNIAYSWSFGDGSFGQGKHIVHTYKFPGEYVVVLNASYSDTQAVDTVSVTVYRPEIVLKKIPGGLEIQNKGAEINFSGWYMSNGVTRFNFPTDTIIASKKNIVIDDQVSGMYTTPITLYTPFGAIFSAVETPQVLPEEVSLVQTYPSSSTPPIAVAQKKTVPKKAQSAQTAPVAVSAVSKPAKPQSVLTIATTTQQASVIEVFVAPPQKSFLYTMLSWPSALARTLFGRD